MRIDPAIAELRRDPAPQLRAQAALEAARDAWKQRDDVASILDELTRYSAGAEFGACPSLVRVLSAVEAAREIMEPFVSAMTRTLLEHPLGHVPFRHQSSPGLMVLQLATAGRAALSLMSYEARAGRPNDRPHTVCFAGGERRELCLAGSAEIRLFEVLYEEPDRADLECEECRIAEGDALVYEGARRTKIVDRPHRRMVMLRVSRSELAPVAAKEYRISDGTLVHCASGDSVESRDEMAAAVLGAMRRADAAPVFADMARGKGSDHFRWQALRQLLALDTATGFTALTAIARSHADPLAAHAGALRANLVERHPEFAQWNTSCRAY